MNFIALKMLVGDRLKYIALVAGVAFAALLITQQAAIFTGYAMQTGAWVRDTSYADLWVTDPQVEFSDDLKPMSDTALQRVRSVAGVEWAVPLYKGWLKCRMADGTRLQVRVIGLDDASLAGGPPTMEQGALADLRQDRAVIANFADLSDKLLPRRGGEQLKVGERISINDNDAVIVGTYRATPEFFWEPVLYTTYSRAISWAPRETKLLNYILVRVAGGQSVDQVAQRIKQATGLLARTNKQFEMDTTHWLLVKTGILINFGITIVLGFVIGLLVAGQTFYTFVLDNLRHFAALMAMGAAKTTVLKMLCLQVLVVSALGYGLGLGGASLTGNLLGGRGLAFEMPWQIPVFGAVAVLICSVASACLGMIRVMRLEPALVFKS